jgi:serine/threonine-protein kinase
LKGDANAPLRLTEFTDVLCGHCAVLHETIDRLKTTLPLRAFSVEPRQFPLDPGCNPELTGPPVNPVRCIAARAAICLEGEPDFEDFAGSLFLNQRTLTE